MQTFFFFRGLGGCLFARSADQQHEERHRVCETISAAKEAAIGQLLGRAVQCGAIGFAVGSARRMLREAGEQLRVLPPSRYREALGRLVDSLDTLIARFGS